MGLIAKIVALGVFAFFCGVVWYSEQGRRAMAAADDFEAWAKSQRMVDVEVVVSAPPATSEYESLYLCGDAPALMGWNPTAVKLNRCSDGKYRAKVELFSGVEQRFCVTRGSFDSVEADPIVGTPLIRSEIIAGREDIELTVDRWVDSGQNTQVVPCSNTSR